MDAERRAAPAWGLGDAAAGFLVGLLVSGLVAGLWAAVSGSNRLTLGALAASQAGLWVGLLGAPVLASRRKGSDDLGHDFGLRIRWSDSVLGVPVGVLCQLMLIPLIYLPLHDLVSRRDLEAPVRRVTNRAHGVGFFVLAVVVIVGAPLVEELFFRGLVLSSLQRRFGDGWAVAGSAVAFGLAHFEPLQLPALVALGVVLAVLALRTGRLGPGIFAHAAFNAVTIIALALQR
jgi:membrane protease YdiL (CAAX protease family)